MIPLAFVLTFAFYEFLLVRRNWAPLSVVARIGALGIILTTMFAISRETLLWNSLVASCLIFALTLDTAAQLLGWYLINTREGMLAYDLFAHWMAGAGVTLYLVSVLRGGRLYAWSLGISLASGVAWEVSEALVATLVAGWTGPLRDFTYSLPNSFWDLGAHLVGALAAVGAHLIHACIRCRTGESRDVCCKLPGPCRTDRAELKLY
jgi:hypothetical protein